ncbi:hypothetical protein Pcinc_010194 [Petrolisthes cinctipes]|uniref:Uncharacterized protein n=1 Tax=Petrolisthes cinctipes TaxID=88211 RepID=A0AAE1G5X2_PETCI|nr:hypothetical protein Pcinc_010194 [Petrolisthes cinctipes]
MEEAVAFVYSLSDDEDATAIDMTLEPPDDGAESDGDVLSEDIVDVDENIMLLGPKLLDKPPHIELSNRNTCLEPCLSMSSPIGLQPQVELAEATSQTRKRMKPPKKRLKKTHEWKKCGLEQSSNEKQSLVGYNKVPNRRLFWSRKADTNNPAVMQCGMKSTDLKPLLGACM